MIRIAFQDVDQLLNFINTTSDFESWETVICRVTAKNGMELNIKTDIKDNLGFRDFIELKRLKNLYNPFYTENAYLGVNLEFKLKFPNYLREVIDPSNYYEAMYVNFYSDDTASYLNISFLETSKVLDAQPIKSWGVYITNLYNAWKQKNGIA
jgi:hypothetical protein